MILPHTAPHRLPHLPLPRSPIFPGWGPTLP